MYLFKYLKAKCTVKDVVKLIIVAFSFLIIISLLFYQNSSLSFRNKDAIVNLTTTVTSMHNQLYFILPMLTIGDLLLFNRPTNIEYFRMIKGKDFKKYVTVSTLLPVLILLISYIICVLFFLSIGKEIINPKNVIFGVYLLGCNLLGSFIYLSVVNIIALLSNKLIALIGIEIILLIDYSIFNIFRFSIFLTNGMSIPGNEYGFNVVTDLLIYLAYLIFIDIYLSSFSFKDQIKYE
ncbi:MULTISPECIES: hypothetical protein [Lactobacillus]|uniref:ABC transporter permease n=1 Tax=Lactobacillus xujianguonis TaxID=2495899 RepID=A0A437SX07_9LACO|nr:MULTISPECIES: hypothetical protein [Lactobacillus]RVU71468.1 hypothetical protein EJK17_01845 [Lactobacillus xujianguonis]RVU73691.1 hypothetical protein EJK20_06895 [Lactobacillus xujianguonis]